ncbi:hypothetical protein OH76DRAFT_993843 [Lentinus brumalis]|uniref:Uncharacterized protein n=1 Tax=Lentinus brumalis TaxID=2498619 RepID=A0A371DQD1_9APHY|nr:hypothetical protein OH76DRAFT_993843 [Polyporus brumalis]
MNVTPKTSNTWLPLPGSSCNNCSDRSGRSFARTRWYAGDKCDGLHVRLCPPPEASGNSRDTIFSARQAASGDGDAGLDIPIYPFQAPWPGRAPVPPPISSYLSCSHMFSRHSRLRHSFIAWSARRFQSALQLHPIHRHCNAAFILSLLKHDHPVVYAPHLLILVAMYT